ncbi:serine hydrolase domain-containing protein [Pseudoduganella sp. OTU4001]|uniref:serine hydrolase domain-containing protein n=1 Tax=Pseudoduganella sp. OTU4001 TaxID=3043854 RepID=UPI00313DC67A
MWRKLLLTVATLTVLVSAAASENPPAARRVLVKYSINENDPKQLEEKVTIPLERILRKLERVTESHSMTTHGLVQIELSFKNGATEDDRATVTKFVEPLEIDKALRIISRSITLVPARLPGEFDQANQLARQSIQTIMQDQRIPGLQIAVVKNDNVVFSESYGLANIENNVPASRWIRFPLNSATKAFTGVAVMQLVEAGLVDLDAPLSQYLEDLPQAWRDIRVRQLLAHTSGLPDIVDPQGAPNGGNEAAAWQAARAQAVNAPAGEAFSYNQTNYALLAQIISKQGKMPYDRFIAERQFAIAGMHWATFGDSYDLVSNAATIYAHTTRGLSHWFYEIPHGLWAGGGIQTTADEVAQWLVALSKGRLISQASIRRMWTAEKLNNGKDGEWGGGWPVLQTTPELQVAGIGGARAAFIVYPEQKLAIVVLTNLAGAHPQRFIPQIAEFYKNANQDH